MTTMSLWEPIREGLTLREAINRLFEDSVVTPGPAAAPATRQMALDVIESPDQFVVTASLPGCDKEKVEIHFQHDTLTIKAHTEAMPEGDENKRYLLRERFHGQIARSIQLPVAVNADQARAEYKDGTLVLTLPKAESVKARTIKVC